MIYNFQLIMQPTKNEAFKKMFKSSLGASYFHGFQNNKFTNKSRLQSEKIAEEEEVDENTFRIMTGFLKPDDSYAVYEKTGRFFIEQEGFFACFSSRKRFQVQLKNFKFNVKDGDRLKYCFNFQTENASVSARGDHFILQIDSCPQKFYLQPIQQNKKDQIVDDWVSLINKVVKDSDGKKFKFNYLPDKNEKFYTQYHISNEQFQRSANSLDIVLFRSPHSAAAVQRLFTNSQYDHVGIVLRNRKNQLFVYQSTSNDGVGFTSWKDMVKFEWHKSTEKISWRRLNIKLTPKDIEVVQAFVAKTLGKEFSITLDKLFMFSSTLKRTEEQDQNKTYFCSELAARLYKELGLLDEKKASTTYYPVDFSEKGGMKIMREGCFLEPERVIAFNATR